jgi:ribosomal protein L40E
MHYFHRLIARVRAWQASRRAPRLIVHPLALGFTPPIHREVSAHGVRVFSLCVCCGARLNASATLCEECAQKKSRPARPY